MKQKEKIGFIGQGWIGKNYADYYEEAGYPIVRYALEAPYDKNKDAIKECHVVFIAVPTPTTQNGFDDSIIRDAVKLVGSGNVALIKSTLLPGTTRKIQNENPDIVVMNSPEFLREASARSDVFHPDRNIIGITETNDTLVKRAGEVMALFPKAPYEKICRAEEAELTKYGGNNFLFWKVIFMNMLYDTAISLGADWDVIKENMMADPRIGSSHMTPVHASGHTDKDGRGAGGHCFIKDFSAFRELYEKSTHDSLGGDVLWALEKKNIELLTTSKKDLDLLRGVYGKDIV